jgi:hypothetical protein
VHGTPTANPPVRSLFTLQQANHVRDLLRRIVTRSFETRVYGVPTAPPVIPPTTLPEAGGRGAGKRYPRRAVVEIDGELFDVRNSEEARQLIVAAKQIARAVAPKAAGKGATEAQETAPPVVRVVEPSPDLPNLVAQIQAAQIVIDNIYLQAFEQAERRRREQDDDDAMTILLMG